MPPSSWKKRKVAKTELYYGCVDARRPLGDLGMAIADMHVLRGIAAYIPPGDPAIAASLERALKEGITRITVSGHTDCGGACACVEHNKTLPSVMHSLAALNTVRDGVEKRYPHDKTARLRHMECAIVHESLRNLRSYECVRKAEEKGALTLRGIIIDIATGQQHDITHTHDAPNTTTEFPPHNPGMILFSGMDPSGPAATLGINKGDSLIVRNFGALIKTRDPKTAAELEFAVNAKGVKKIAIALEDDSVLVATALDDAAQTPAFRQYIAPLKNDIAAVRAAHPGDIEAQRQALSQRILEQGLANLRSYAAVSQAENLTLEAWQVHGPSGRKDIVATAHIGTPENEHRKGSTRA